jgi:hypothetical protein
MTGDNAQFGVDISQGAMIAVQDAVNLTASPSNWLLKTMAAHRKAALRLPISSLRILKSLRSPVTSSLRYRCGNSIYEKAGLPMMSPSATNPDLTTTGSMVSSWCLHDALRVNSLPNTCSTRLV